ncbi:MAG TPA: tetratricopeptide repeat protein [Acidimicrobiales bacterium]|nr:tetratricopeptide repeat protein [Acidimicrobiales bacterium]
MTDDPWDLVEAGRYDEALPHLRAALDRAVAEFGAESFEAAVAANQLGVACKFAGAYDEAAAAYARALPVGEQLAAAGEPDLLATLLHNLGGLAHSRGHYAEAEPIARRGLELRRAECGDDNEAVAADAAALAAILEHLERWSEAEALFEEALERWEAAGDAYEAAMTRNGLAAVLRFSGRTDDAEALFRVALRDVEVERGGDHPDAATVRNNLAMLLNANGRPAEALPLLDRAARDLEAMLGPTHPATVDIVANRARVAAHAATGVDPGPPA